MLELLPGKREAGVVFDGENSEECEQVSVDELEVVGTGFQMDPDTAASPLVAQLLTLLDALLGSSELRSTLCVPSSVGSSDRTHEEAEGVEDAVAMAQCTLLSRTLAAVIQLSAHCPDVLTDACREREHLMARVLTALLELAARPMPVPALLTEQVPVMTTLAVGHQPSIFILAVSTGVVAFLRPAVVQS